MHRRQQYHDVGTVYRALDFLAFVVDPAAAGRFHEAVELAHAMADVVTGQMKRAHRVELRRSWRSISVHRAGTVSAGNGAPFSRTAFMVWLPFTDYRAPPW